MRWAELHGTRLFYDYKCTYMHIGVSSWSTREKDCVWGTGLTMRVKDRGQQKLNLSGFSRDKYSSQQRSGSMTRICSLLCQHSGRAGCPEDIKKSKKWEPSMHRAYVYKYKDRCYVSMLRFIALLEVDFCLVFINEWMSCMSVFSVLAEHQSSLVIYYNWLCS